MVMKSTNTFFMFFLCFTIISCSKNKPESGSYAGYFHYEYPQSFDEYSSIEVTEPTKDHIVINGSKLQKDGKKISGMIYALDFGSFVEINGEWSHNVFDKKYTIKGTFTQIKYQGGDEYEFGGTFSIKTK